MYDVYSNVVQFSQCPRQVSRYHFLRIPCLTAVRHAGYVYGKTDTVILCSLLMAIVATASLFCSFRHVSSFFNIVITHNPRRQLK